MPYGFYLTDKGKELIAASLDGGEKVTISKACFGSGGDPSAEEFDGSITDLEEQFYEKELDPQTDSVKPLESNLSQLEIITEVPPSVEGTISEIGYKDQNDNLILYGLIQRQVKEAAANVSFLYDNFVYFENEENRQIEFYLATPEYERVEQLINETKSSFESSITEIQSILETAKQELDIQAYLDKIAEFEQRVKAMEDTLGDSITRLDTAL